SCLAAFSEYMNGWYRDEPAPSTTELSGDSAYRECGIRERNMGHIDPTREVFAQFRADDRPGPIHMLNLVRLRAHAAYPDGRPASGAEAYAAYGRESGP